MILKLTKLANTLDQKGYYKLADDLDCILKLAIDEWEYHGFNSSEDYEQFKKHKGFVPEEEQGKLVTEEKQEVSIDTALCNGCGKETDLDELADNLYGEGFNSLPEGFRLQYNTNPSYAALCNECEKKARSMIEQQPSHLKDFVKNSTNFAIKLGGKLEKIKDYSRWGIAEILFSGLSDDKIEEFTKAYGGKKFKDQVFGSVEVDVFWSGVPGSKEMVVEIITDKLPSGVKSLEEYISSII